MDFFKGVGNFFNGIFGGKDDDEEKRRREQQRRAQEAARKAAAMPKVLSPKAQTEWKAKNNVPTPQVPKPQKPTVQAPVPQAPRTVSLNEFMQKPRITVQPKPGVQPPAKNQTLETATKVVAAPFKFVGDFLVKPAVDEATKTMNQAKVMAEVRKQGVWTDQPGKQDDAKVKKAIEVAEKKTGIKKLDDIEAFSTGINTAANLTGIGEFRQIAMKTGEGIVAGLKEPVADIIKELEKRMGRKLTEDETKTIAERIANDLPALDAKKEAEATQAITDKEYRARQEAERAKQHQNPLVKAANTVKREVYDPQAIAQKYDNAEFAARRGKDLLPGQKTLLNQESLTAQQSLINNPVSAAKARMRDKFEVEGEQFSLEDIIKTYGKEHGKRAQDFAQYRLYKDELERQGRGADNTLGVDPREMALKVTEYEKANPKALRHNEALRQMALRNLRERLEVGDISQEMFDNSASLQFYAPRTRVNPDEAPQPRFSGFIRGGNSVKNRGKSANTVEAPLSLLIKDNVDTVRAVASQRRGQIVRDRVERGTMPGEVLIDAAKVGEHKAAIKTMADLADNIAELKGASTKLRTDKRLATKEADGALKLEKTAAKGEVKTAKAEVKELEARAAAQMKRHLERMGADDRFADLAPYVNNMKEKELVDLFLVLSDSNVKNIPAIAKKLAAKIDKQAAAQARLAGVADADKVIAARNTADRLKEELQSVRDEIAEVKQQRSAAYQEMRDTTQYETPGENTIAYKVDGEIGKIAIDPAYSDELRSFTDSLARDMIGRGLSTVATAQKILVTGVLAPAFKVFQTLIVNPSLAFFNGDMLSGVGLRAGEAMVRQLFNPTYMNKFRREIAERGATFENAVQSRNTYMATADDIAARGNMVDFFIRNPASTAKDIVHAIDLFVSSIPNAQRTAVAYGAYKQAVRRGIPEEQALQVGAQAPVKIFGDLERVSNTARSLEPLLLYSGATQAGVRAMVRTTRTMPGQALIKASVMGTSMAALVAHGLQANAQYYKDMYDADKEYVLDTGIPIILPGAHKDGEGNWLGVYTMPIPPDFRPFWRTVRKTTEDIATEQGIDVGMVAANMFNQFTGDMANNIYNKERGEENAINGLFANSPIVAGAKILNDKDVWTGDPLVEGRLAAKDKIEQIDPERTSQAAINISQLFGGVISPIQADALLSQIGATGDAMQDKNENGNPLDEFFDVAKRFMPGKAMTDKAEDGREFYQDLDVVKKTIGDDKTFEEFEALHAKKAEDAPENLLTSATKAMKFMSYDGEGGFMTTPLFEAEKKLDALARARGKAGNPIFDLGPQELQKVLTYRAGKIYNAAKQNYSKGGEGAFTALGLDEQWYSDFQKAEDAYWKAVLPESDDEMKTFSGKSKPKLTPEQEEAEKLYYTLPKGTGARKAFLAANPWLADHWDKSNDFTDEERKALGFNSLNGDNVFDGTTAADDKGYGGGGSSWDPSDENLLPRLLNLSNDLARLNLSPETEKAVALELRRFFAPRRGGRASVTIGANASGNPRA